MGSNCSMCKQVIFFFKLGSSSLINICLLFFFFFSPEACVPAKSNRGREGRVFRDNVRGVGGVRQTEYSGTCISRNSSQLIETISWTVVKLFSSRLPKWRKWSENSHGLRRIFKASMSQPFQSTETAAALI